MNFLVYALLIKTIPFHGIQKIIFLQTNSIFKLMLSTELIYSFNVNSCHSLAYEIFYQSNKSK